jgi:hypothetical protein
VNVPRINGIRERLYLNLYDAANLMELDQYQRLFGNKNIGKRELTNMFVAGQLHSDMSFVIANVYTRTNLAGPRPRLTDDGIAQLKQLFVDGHDADAIGTMLRAMTWERSPLARALEEWSHVARVEVIVGEKPMFEMNFHDLMDGPALGPSHRPPITVNKNTGEPEHLVGGDDKVLPWRKEIGRVIVVPVRQNISVTLTAPEAPTRALRRLATEAGVLPAPLAWVHLEGLGVRNVHYSY